MDGQLPSQNGVVVIVESSFNASLHKNSQLLHSLPYSYPINGQVIQSSPN